MLGTMPTNTLIGRVGTAAAARVVPTFLKKCSPALDKWRLCVIL